MAIARRILCALNSADTKSFTENGDTPSWLTGDLGRQMWEDAVNADSFLREAQAAQEKEEKVEVEVEVASPLNGWAGGIA